ncbi:protein unc-13 homolog D-like isoform X2 [Haliotis rufescens]|uniref:protein unc-13 homolog D-like isoform X2 n=1 Tax=Haliotis rufescens TaxID=6454 RepID=UPI00201F2171|nr:protein unc-13 homolog D-like isoform X2 [Haliotis rufescens]
MDNKTRKLRVHEKLRRTSSEYLYVPDCSYDPYSDEIENEALFRGLLRSLLHPLGTPDSEIGLRPGDLVDHLRQVFAIDQDDHEYFIREEAKNKPTKIQVCATVIEARNLKVADKPPKVQSECNPYCILTIVNPTKNSRYSPIASPKVSPRSSPRNSPLPSRRHLPPRSSSQDYGSDVLRSQTARGFAQPKWNEEFYLEIEDLLTDELHVCFFSQDSDVIHQENKHPDKGGNFLKSFFRNVLASSSDHDKYIPGCIGRIVVPVRDIATNSVDRWMNVFPVGPVSARTKPVGQCRVRLAISYMQSGACFSVEDYHQVSLIHHKHAVKINTDCTDSALLLSPQSRRILDTFAIGNRISKLSQSILDLTVLLELVASPEKEIQCLSDTVLHKSLEEVQMTWLAMQACGQELTQRMPLSDSEICLYRTGARNYISSLTSKLHELPSLFPPSAESLVTLKGSLGLAIHLLELDLWDSSSSTQNELADKLLQKLQSDIDLWMTEKLQEVYSHKKVKDSVIPEMKSLTESIRSLASHCSPLGVITKFYGPLGVKYYRVVAFRTERKLSTTAREMMLEMDKYMVRYHNFPVNIAQSSRHSLALYFAIRKFYLLIKEGLTDRDMFRLTISQYQRWFQESLVFWLQTFKTECMTRMEKALEIDKDVVLVTSLVKFSNSSVDVLSCFAKITQEWREIDFKDPDSVVMGVTKITDLICDGARLYADKIHTILERNCYYDQQEEQFDVNDRLCITLNNIEHVRQYLNHLPELLEWEEVGQSQSARHEDAKIGRQSLTTLKRLTTTANQDILMKSSFLLREIAVKMKTNIQKLMDMFIVKTPAKVSAVDKTIGYLSTNLQTLDDRLMTSIYPKMIEELWEVVLQIFYEQMQIGQKPDYYEHMKRHLGALTTFFLSCGLEEKLVQGAAEAQLRARIHLNCQQTGILMQEYFQGLANGMSTPPEYLGHLAIKAAYVEETKGMVTIGVKVMRASDLPGLDNSGLSDPYVLMNLQPPNLFHNVKPVRTKVVEKTLNPIFNESFQFPNIPSSLLTEPGACILFSVLDHDYMVSDDFAGEVALNISALHPIRDEEYLDSTPVVMMPLKRPQHVADGAFQVLEERSSWDKEAKAFVTDRLKYIINQPRRQGKNSQNSFFSFFGLGT